MGLGAQGLGLHVVPGPWNVPLCAAQLAAVVTKQNVPLPKPTQHAPTCGGLQPA